MTTKTLKDLFEVYKPKSPDEQKFVDKHVTIKHKDRNGNGDDVFNATNVKTVKRKEEGHGYEPGEDEKVYEEVDSDLENELKATRQTKKSVGGKWKSTSYKTADGKWATKDVKEEVEEIDELSRATIGRYSQKAKSIADNEGGKDRSKGRELAGRKKWGGSMAGVEKAKVMASEEVEELDELSNKTLGSYVKKAKDQMSRSDTLAGRAMGAREHGAKPTAAERKHNERANKRYFGIDKAVDKMTKEETEVSDELTEGMMKLSKVHIVHHHDHPAAKEFAKHYTAGMKGDHREGGPTEADDKAADTFHSRYTGVRTREGFAGSGTHVYTDHKTGAKWKVDRHPNGKTFYGTDHIISHHTGPIHESFGLEEGEVLDTVAEDRVLRSLVAYYEELGEEVLIDDIIDIAEGLISELSKDTVRNYYNKAGHEGSKIMGKMAIGGGDWSKDGKDTKTLAKRAAGRKMAMKRRTGEVKMSEESQIDELSVNKLDQYRSKARRDLIDADANDDTGTYNKRAKGYRAASKQVQKKLTKEDVINITLQKIAPVLEDVAPLTPEERLVSKLDGLSESHVHLLLSLFESLNEDNQTKMLSAVDTKEGIAGLIDFAIENRGE